MHPSRASMLFPQKYTPADPIVVPISAAALQPSSQLIPQTPISTDTGPIRPAVDPPKTSIVNREMDRVRDNAKEEVSNAGSVHSEPPATPSLSITPPAPTSPAHQLRQRAVPSNSITRALGFAGLGASLLYGAAKDSVSRAWQGPQLQSSDTSGAPVYSSFLSESNAERLAAALCRMRGAALKLGQMLSIQDENVLPPQFQAALERVRAGADSMPQRQLHRVLSAELGPDWRSRISAFDDMPMAAASIGQVHAARLHDGREVVVKVQYPGVAKSIEADVDNLMRLIRVANVLPKGLYVENAVAVAKRELALECDYRYEAQAQAKFRELVRADPYCAAHFNVPLVIPELSSERVLTSERVTGVHIDAVAGMNQATRDAVGTRLLTLTLRELYEWRYMQTDPNWGNFLYDASTDVLHLIDFGAAKEFSLDFVSEYLEMVRSCSEKDADGIIKSSTTLGFLTGDESAVMLDAHVQAAIAVGTPFSKEGLYDFGAHGALTRRVTELGAVMLKHRLTPPPDESYSLHRKLSGAFLACIKLGAKVPCRQVFYEAYERHRAGNGSVRDSIPVAAGA